MQEGKKILMVVTSCDRFDAEHQTGLWLEEFAVPYQQFLAAGYEVAVASPKGGQAPIDQRSMSGALPSEWNEAIIALSDTSKLEQVDYTGFAAVVLPGGHGPLFDLAQDQHLAAVLRYFDANQRVIAAVCHGPAGLVGATTEAGKSLVEGRKVTGFTNEEERIVGLDQLVPFALESRLKELGADFSAEDPWRDWVVIDRNLITGQNPQSSASFGRAVLQVLAKA